MTSRPQTVSQFLKQALVLIVDECFASRIALRESMVEMGVDRENLIFARTIQEAISLIRLRKPHIVVSEYVLTDGLGIELLQEGREFLFFLISSDSSNAAVAAAAEFEVDQFLFKPYDRGDLKRGLNEMLAEKFASPLRFTLIRNGKEALDRGWYDEALKNFEYLKTNPQMFVTGCAYAGETLRYKKDYELSKLEFLKGLKENEIHFKCLSGLYETLITENSIDDAYAILKRLILNFPEHPGRLSQGVTLAIQTKNFLDIDIYYEVFKSIHQRTETLINHMGSALSVAGRFHLLKKNVPAAIRNFERSLEIAAGQSKFLGYIVGHLVEMGYGREAAELQQRFGSPDATA